MPESRLCLLPSDPTAETFARWLYDRAVACLEQVLRDSALRPEPAPRVQKVVVNETATNAAEYEP